MKTIVVAMVLTTGCALLSGCLQSKLLSEDSHVRMSAVAMLNREDLINVVKGSQLSNPNDNLIYGAKENIPYPYDVKKAAIDKLYADRKYFDLLELYEIDGRNNDCKPPVKGETPLMLDIRKKMSTSEHWAWLCKSMLDGSIVARNFLEAIKDEKFYVWAIRNEHNKAIAELFDFPAGEDIIKNIETLESLKVISTDKGIDTATRLIAAKKMFLCKTVSGADVIGVVSSFDGVSESVLVEVVEDGIKCAERIGANEVSKTLFANHHETIKRVRVANEKFDARVAFWKKVGDAYWFLTDNPPRVTNGGIFEWGDTYWPHRYNVVVKHVLQKGVIVGARNAYERVQTGVVVNHPVYTEYHFPNKIFVKTDTKYANGDNFDSKYLKHVGIENFSTSGGGKISLHVFEPYVIPEEMYPKPILLNR